MTRNVPPPTGLSGVEAAAARLRRASGQRPTDNPASFPTLLEQAETTIDPQALDEMAAYILWTAEHFDADKAEAFRVVVNRELSRLVAKKRAEAKRGSTRARRK